MSEGNEAGPDPATPSSTTTEPPTETPVSPSDAALARYRSSMRRGRGLYYGIVAVIVVALGVVAAVGWSRSEVAHVRLHTVAPAPSTLPVAAPASTPQPAWKTADRAALGAPQWGGTVVTYSGHTVGGRDARTGRATWTYTRTDRTVCTAAQLNGTTIAVFAVHGNCDELTALDSGTGHRRWTRTLDMDGMPVDGRPSWTVTPFTLLATTPDVVYAIDPVTGFNRWTYDRFGCRIGGVALGTQGALISQTCSAEVRCTGVKFCGRGPQLLLRDGSAGRDDNDKANPDQIKWNRIGNASRPASADQVLSAVEPGGRSLALLAAKDGRTTASVPLSPAAGGAAAIGAVPASDAVLVWVAGRVYALRGDATTPVWTAATAAPPTVVTTTDDDPPPLATARITVPTAGGVAILDGNDGRVAQRYAVTAPGSGAQVYPLGSGFLIAGRSGITAYR